MVRQTRGTPPFSSTQDHHPSARPWHSSACICKPHPITPEARPPRRSKHQPAVTTPHHHQRSAYDATPTCRLSRWRTADQRRSHASGRKAATRTVICSSPSTQRRPTASCGRRGPARTDARSATGVLPFCPRGDKLTCSEIRLNRSLVLHRVDPEDCETNGDDLLFLKRVRSAVRRRSMRI